MFEEKENQNTLISFDDFKKVKMCAGTIIEATLNQKAKIPAYVLTIDFGELGIKTSSAQITQHYTPESLISMQIIAVMNFPPKKVAGVNSQILVLACVSNETGTVLLQPTHHVPNGSIIA
ncbi:MAG: tRNA-binding protein [Proteobacteria bacterium]|nr:tRNA-binding protein [Pseudomonadota bacterium]